MANEMNQFDAFFKRADLDGDGQISGAEAVAFLQGSGLPRHVLAQVWAYADQRKAGFLNRQEFYNVLKLVTVAQSKRELTPDMVKAALYGPASAKIPAPRINLPATPAPRAPAPVPQVTGVTSVASQDTGVRPPLVPGNASVNQQYFASQQNQLVRPPQGMPVNSVTTSQQVLDSQSLPRGGNMTAPRPPISTVSSGWSGGSIGIPTAHNENRGVSPPASRDGFGLMAPSLATSAQPGLQVTAGQLPATTPKAQDAAVLSSKPPTKDSNVSKNGFASEPVFGDVFSASPVQPTQNSSSTAPSSSALPVSSTIATSSVVSQPAVRTATLDSLQGTYSQQSLSGQSTGLEKRPIVGQTPAVTHGISVGSGNSASSQSQPLWPKMTQAKIQKYMEVFVQVDTNRDGKITGEQARNLFLSWRLPREVLKQVWDLSDQDNDGMLSLREFCIAVYLIEGSRDGRPLPTTLPSSVMSDETLLSATRHPTAAHGIRAWEPSSVSRQPQVVPGPRPIPPAAARPPRPPPVHHTDEKQPIQQKPKVPVLEKHLVDQLSQDEQDSLNSKFQEAAQADKKVVELEKEIADSRQKIEFCRVKMQELILYKSRCDNRLNEVSERVIADKREVEALAKKYEEKYNQTGGVASKLTIEEATFRDIQERKMELYRAIVKLEEGGTADGALKERAERIRSSLEELVKNVNERCKEYGLRAKPMSLTELPFGWQPGVQEGAADWDEDWDKFEDEGFTFVKELTLDVKNVVAPPKPKPSVQKETSANGDTSSSPSKAKEKMDKTSTLQEPDHEKESPRDRSKNGVAKSPPGSAAERNATDSQSHDFQDSPSRSGTSADGSPHAKEIQSDLGGSESVFSGDRSGNLPGWGTFDTHYDTESNWGSESVSGKDFDLGMSEFGLNPIKTGSSHMYQGKSPFLLADSVPSTPAYNQGRGLFADSVPSTPGYSQGRGLFADSVPSTPAYNPGRSLFADSLPSTPAYNQGKNSFGFADSVPGTPAYNQGNSFDSFSRFDSFNLPDSGAFHSPRQSLGRFDSMRSTRDSDQGYGFPSRFDSFSEAGDSDQNLGFSRFDSFRDSDQSHGLSRFDSFKDSDQSHGFSRFDSFGDSDQGHGFSRFDSFRDSDQGHGFPSRFDSFRENDNSNNFAPSFDSFSANESGFFQSTGKSSVRSDSVRSTSNFDNSHAFSSFDDTDPFGSSGPFRTSAESETPRRSSDNWRAF